MTTPQTKNKSTSQPYCEHPECHDTVTAYYAESWTWTASNSAPSLPSQKARQILTWFSHPPTSGVRRLCTIHARHEFGISVGGRIHARKAAA